MVTPTDQGKKKEDTAKVKKVLTTTRRITTANGATLVEWYGGGRLHRSWVKKDMILEDNGSEVLVDGPERGVPYGDDLSEVFVLNTEIKRDFAKALNDQGIWTYQDISLQPQVVQGVLQSVYGVALSNVLQAAAAATKAAKAE